MRRLVVIAMLLFTLTPPGMASAHKPTVFCPGWKELAKQAGWEVKHLAKLDYIMFRESRCEPKALNTTRNRDGSWDYGLVQINNKTWCLPSRHFKDGYLQKHKIISQCTDLFNPMTNLIAALAIYAEADYSFSPWGL